MPERETDRERVTDREREGQTDTCIQDEKQTFVVEKEKERGRERTSGRDKKKIKHFLESMPWRYSTFSHVQANTCNSKQF